MGVAPELGERQAAAGEPEEVQRLKREFLASLNHEVRTPLSGIIGMTDLLAETQLDEEQKEYLNATRLCAEELLELLDSALEYSSLAAGKMELVASEFNLVEVLRGVTAEALPKAESKGLRLITNLEEDLPALVVGDAVRLRQILRHLVSNAVKFTARGQVELAAHGQATADGGFLLKLEVRDTGPGIEPEHLAVIFQPFRQLDGGLARKQPGLGLGLALTEKLVALMQGQIRVDSQPGQGTLFSLSIPLQAAVEAAPEPPAPRAQPPCILLVEDNLVAQQIAAHILLHGHYQVESVSSGEAAVRAAARQRYDLILMDLQMPGMDGLATMRQIRRLPEYALVPVIALTAHTTDEYRVWCRQQGMQGFLPKPVQPAELLATVARHLRL